MPIFFVLSGFLLSLPFAEWQAGLRRRPALGKYFLHRIARVFPAYYAQLAILLAIAAITGGLSAVPDPAALLRHLGMLFVPPPVGTSPLNGVWWTLPVEFSFYLALPFLAFLLRPGRWWWLTLASLASMYLWRHAVVLRLADAPISERVITSWQLPGAFDMFGLGMLAAVLHVNRRRLPSWLSRALGHRALAASAVATLLVAAYWLAGDRQHFWADYPIFYLWTPAVGTATALLILTGVGGDRLANALFGNRPMVFLGLVSYSLYLWHLPIIDWLIALPGLQPLMGQGFTARLAVTLAATLAVATLSYVAVERPVMRWRAS